MQKRPLVVILLKSRALREKEAQLHLARQTPFPLKTLRTMFIRKLYHKLVLISTLSTKCCPLPTSSAISSKFIFSSSSSLLSCQKGHLSHRHVLAKSSPSLILYSSRRLLLHSATVLGSTLWLHSHFSSQTGLFAPAHFLLLSLDHFSHLCLETNSFSSTSLSIPKESRRRPGQGTMAPQGLLYIINDTREYSWSWSHCQIRQRNQANGKQHQAEGISYLITLPPVGDVGTQLLVTNDLSHFFNRRVRGH